MSIGRPGPAANLVASVLLLVFSVAVSTAVVVGSDPLLWTSLAGPVVLGVLGVVGLVDVRRPRTAGERVRSGACQVTGGLLLAGGALLDVASADWTLFDDAIAVGAGGGLLLTVIGAVRLARARRRSHRGGARAKPTTAWPTDA